MVCMRMWTCWYIHTHSYVPHITYTTAIITPSQKIQSTDCSHFHRWRLYFTLCVDSRFAVGLILFWSINHSDPEWLVFVCVISNVLQWLEVNYDEPRQEYIISHITAALTPTHLPVTRQRRRTKIALGSHHICGGRARKRFRWGSVYACVVLA